MCGQFPKGALGQFGKKVTTTTAASAAKAKQPDLSVDGKKITGPKTEFGLSRLGESKPFGPEPVELTGTTPPNRKKPTITLLGEKP